MWRLLGLRVGRGRGSLYDRCVGEGLASMWQARGEWREKIYVYRGGGREFVCVCVFNPQSFKNGYDRISVHVWSSFVTLSLMNFPLQPISDAYFPSMKHHSSLTLTTAHHNNTNADVKSTGMVRWWGDVKVVGSEEFVAARYVLYYNLYSYNVYLYWCVHYLLLVF